MNDQETIIELRAELMQTKANLEEIQRRYRGLPQADKDAKYKDWHDTWNELEPGLVLPDVPQLAAMDRDELNALQAQLAEAREHGGDLEKALLRVLVVVAEVHGIKMVDVMRLVQEAKK